MSGYDEKVWAYSNTGTKAHAFVQNWADRDGNVSGNYKRAMCRSTIARPSDAIYAPQNEVFGKCTRCVDLFVAMVRRAEASMEPATEAHDLGYVAPVDERPAAHKPIPADMNRELLRQARAVAIATERLFPKAPQPETLRDAQNQCVAELRQAELDKLHALALQMDAQETRCAEEGGRPWGYQAWTNGPGLGEAHLGRVYAKDAEEARNKAREKLSPLTPLRLYVTQIF